jgi:hypothetical protein
LAPNAIHCSHGLREPKYHSSNCYFRLTKVRGVTSKSKHSEIFRLAICSEAYHTVKSYLPKLPENLTCSNDNSDSEDHEQQEEDSIECDPTFEARCSSSQLNLLRKGDFNGLVRDLNLSEKEAELLCSKLKGWTLLHQDTEIYFFRIRENELK